MAIGFRDRRANDIAVVRLTHKYAEVIDDVDLSSYSVGDTLELRGRDARLLVAEGWAEAIAERRSTHQPAERSVVTDSGEAPSRRAGEPIGGRFASEAGVARPTKAGPDL